MIIKLNDDLKTQMLSDDIECIYIKDFISYDIDISGNIEPEMETVFKNSYLKKLERGLDNWWINLKSDNDWYKNLKDNCIVIHFDDLFIK